MNTARNASEEAQTLFTRELTCWSDWGRVFQDREAFAGLAAAVYRQQGWGKAEPLEPLTPGTHAVFKAGDKVIKIYAPRAVGFMPREERKGELSAMERAAAAGIAVPRVLGRGMISDQYEFYYMVTEYVKGPKAGPWLKEQDAAGKGGFCRALAGLLDAYHGAPRPGDMEPVRRRALENPRWRGHGPELVAQARRRLAGMPLTGGVWVHGDVTGDNVLVGDRGPVLLDFADGCFAPAWYEWPPLFADLLDGDRAMIALFTAGLSEEEAARTLCDALLLHDFGPDILADMMLRQRGAGRLPESLEELMEFCRRYLA